METMMRLILDGLYCLVALCAGGFFVAMIYTDIKKDQRMKKWPGTGRTGRRISSQADGILPEQVVVNSGGGALCLAVFSR